MMLTGLETTKGATPAAMKTAKTKGGSRVGCSGYRVRISPMTSGVSRRTAASLLRIEAVARLSAKTDPKSDLVVTPFRLKTRRARRSNTPTRAAAAVMSMIEEIVTRGRQSVSAAPTMSCGPTVPARRSASAPPSAAVAGPIRRLAPMRGRPTARLTVRANVEQARNVCIRIVAPGA